MKNTEWILIDWDGNRDLKLKCYRKAFGKGYVSVGCGDFLTICHSFGANNVRSHSDTRWRVGGVLTEQEAMDMVDKKYNKGIKS